jgi:SAM-dependent methyltransferase
MSRFYHLTPTALARRVKRHFDRRRWPEDFASDDYDWRSYREEYASELRRIAKSHSQQLRPGQYEYVNGSLEERVGEAAPLHPNHRLLYETILQLGPGSVLEAGCGGGDHLHNLSLLAPDIELWGLDRSPEQLAFLGERTPHLRARSSIFDLSLPFSQNLPSVDLCFTQAVLMHIHTGNGHLVGLSNLFRMSQRQVVLMENWSRHQFLEDVQRLHREGMIPWLDLFCYFRRAPEYGDKPHLMVLSSEPLEYEALDDYAVLLG